MLHILVQRFYKKKNFFEDAWFEPSYWCCYLKYSLWHKYSAGVTKVTKVFITCAAGLWYDYKEDMDRHCFKLLCQKGCHQLHYELFRLLSRETLEVKELSCRGTTSNYKLPVKSLDMKFLLWLPDTVASPGAGIKLRKYRFITGVPRSFRLVDIFL